jgi:hypothetical protein
MQIAQINLCKSASSVTLNQVMGEKSLRRLTAPVFSQAISFFRALLKEAPDCGQLLHRIVGEKFRASLRRGHVGLSDQFA